jgi:hypothetical protein
MLTGSPDTCGRVRSLIRMLASDALINWLAPAHTASAEEASVSRIFSLVFVNNSLQINSPPSQSASSNVHFALRPCLTAAAGSKRSRQTSCGPSCCPIGRPMPS